LISKLDVTTVTFRGAHRSLVFPHPYNRPIPAVRKDMCR
jgi:hypothetical protein